MDCLFIRHGIAVEAERWRGRDADRPLTPTGNRRVRRAAAGLASLHVTPTHLLTSPLLRARETARLIQKVLCPSLQPALAAELAPGSNPEQLLATLRHMPAEAVVLCIGHEPLLGRIAALSIFGKVSGNMPLKKAGAACIRFSGETLPGQGLLQWWLQPAQLRALGKGMRKGNKKPPRTN
jgi:phosphohistidine phosphatase